MRAMLRRLQYNAPVILTLFFASLGALVLGYLTQGWTTLHLFAVYRSSLLDPLFYVRLFGHVLGHADADHFLGNMLLLLVVGPPLEEKYGSAALLKAILITAVLTGGAQMLLFPHTALLGASGVVFMMIVLSSLSGMREGGVPLTLILVAVFYLGGEILTAVTQKDQISQLTHVLGGLCGAGIGFALAGRGRR